MIFMISFLILIIMVLIILRIFFRNSFNQQLLWCCYNIFYWNKEKLQIF